MLSGGGTDDGLAYLFWHAAPDDDGSYETVLSAWHAALSADPPLGLRAAWTWRLTRPPWLATWPSMVHLDVYLVATFADLGLLDAAAPLGSRQAAHDGAAARSIAGSGGVMACASGPALTPSDALLSFYDKPRGASYPETVASLAGPARSVWVRRLVLGVAPELLVVAAPTDHTDSEADARAVWSASAAVVAGSRARRSGPGAAHDGRATSGCAHNQETGNDRHPNGRPAPLPSTNRSREGQRGQSQPGGASAAT